VRIHAYPPFPTAFSTERERHVRERPTIPVNGVVASGAVGGNPSLRYDEDLAFVVVEGPTARRLVVGDEAIELVEGGKRVGLLETPGDPLTTDALPTTAALGPSAGSCPTVGHHSDKGVQSVLVARLRPPGRQRRGPAVVRVDRPPYDNAAMATFRARLKTEIAWIRGGTHFRHNRRILLSQVSAATRSM